MTCTPYTVIMSSSTAFAHALSPYLEGLTNAMHNISSVTLDDVDEKIKVSNDRLFVLQAKIAECCSVKQVIDTVYSDYRPALREHLLLYALWCEKREMVKASLERLTSTLGAQSIPPRLHVKAPEFQFTQEFRESNDEAALAARKAFTAVTATYQEAINAASLAGKEAELDFWKDRCSLATLLAELSDLLATVWQERQKSFKVPTVNYDANRRANLGEWLISPQNISNWTRSPEPAHCSGRELVKSLPSDIGLWRQRSKKRRR